MLALKPQLPQLWGIQVPHRLTNMGISHPIKHGHINVGESLPHTAPMEVNLVNVPINEGSETATPTIAGNSSPTRH